ncbi:MAG: NADH-quinone oxidoreductase subunit A [Proteobacteria bacterium]|nr:NADH-quinone oxidoreductase subunit A [Pseudomonadota bacterium]
MPDTNDGVVTAALQESQNLWPFLIYALSVAALLALVLIASAMIGQRTKNTRATDMPFESGILSVGSADQTRLTIEFYLIAMFFVIFDLETIFIFAWAVAFFELGWRGYIGVSVFIVILLVALVYEWKTGALDWGKLRRRARSGYSLADTPDTASRA